jgi:hypothetical protein
MCCLEHLRGEPVIGRRLRLPLWFSGTPTRLSGKPESLNSGYPVVRDGSVARLDCGLFGGVVTDG